jgi:hypothetical protein
MTSRDTDTKKASITVLEIEDPGSLLEPRSRALLTEYLAGQLVLTDRFRLAVDAPADRQISSKITRSGKRCTVTVEDASEEIDCTEEAIIAALHAIAEKIAPRSQ